MFARHYHWFSLQQVLAFAGIFQVVPAEDRTSLSELAVGLADELGGGHVDAVHSVMFERFAEEVGVDLDTLPLAAAQVLPAVQAYVEKLRRAFSESVVAAAAAYRFSSGQRLQVTLR